MPWKTKAVCHQTGKEKERKTFDVKIWMVAVDGTIFIKLFQAKPFKRISKWWQQEVGVSQVHSLILFSTQTFSSGNFYIKLPPPPKKKTKTGKLIEMQTEYWKKVKWMKKQRQSNNPVTTSRVWWETLCLKTQEDAEKIWEFWQLWEWDLR